MMKIAFVSTNGFAPWGGSEELWSQTAIRMSQQGFTVGVSIKGWTNEAKQVSEMEASGCIVVRRWYNKSRIQRLVSRLYNSDCEFGFLDQFRPELVIISQGDNTDGLNCMEACLERSIPFVVITQVATESMWPCDEVVIRLAKAYTKAEQCFFVSHANLKLTEKQLTVKLENAKVIRNPFKVSYETKLSWPEENRNFKLACVARLDPLAKGQDLLFELLKTNNWKTRPLEISLFGNGSNSQSLRQLKILWNLENVHFYGLVNNIESIWETHHALILPSRFEGLPLAVVEAMLCARPCIVTDVGGNSEVIQDGVSGFIAAAPKLEFLDEALERAWQKRDSWYEIGQTAAIKIRDLIPRDPIGVFADELKILVK
ncbi:hypothetical protein CDG79_03150 [Nostoc sp. 'Peltigera membranacea cyanobiont' 232]|nr:hypothetical protein CDG79_03150 [Nostoc sp. 'Peltigera membranacea cyanobiont' 232]